MPTNTRALASATSLLALAIAPSAHAFNIVLDYTYDTGNYFSNLTAKAALEAAASDLSSVLTNTLNPISSDVYSGTNGDTTATIDWRLSITHPSAGGTVHLSTFSFGANEYRVYVGARVLPGSTLGQGGPGGAGFTLGGSGFPDEWIGAVSAAETASNLALLRGSGPQIGSLTGSSTFGDFTANYDLRYGLTVGNLWFDSDADWHFDHTTSVASGKSDFYSVALHELIHSLGAGGSDAWDANHTGTTWTGAEAIALHGTGANFLNLAEDHIAPGILSTTFTGGNSQEVVMDPDITTGSRKYITALDLAVLRDLGFETASTIPEPATASSLVALAALALGARRRRNA